MRSRHPLGIMISGAVVSVVLAAIITLVTGGFEAGRASGRDGLAGDVAAPSGPLPTARPADPERVAGPLAGPVISSNFPDPEMIKVGDVYHAYATNSGGKNLPVATAPTPQGPWTMLDVEGLPALGAWAESGKTWAPDVSIRSDGSFLLYYTARSKQAKMQCIGAAVSTRPTGPFTPVGNGPMICPTAYGDAIDAASFVDNDGTRYVLFRTGSAPKSGGNTAIYLQRVSPDGLTLQGNTAQLLVRGPSDPVVVEAPALVRQGNGYVLFYSTDVFYSSGYRTDYATARTITGPYQRAAGPLLGTQVFGKKIVGPGAADVLREQGGDRIVFHGILDFLPGSSVVRGMYVADLGWDGMRPVVKGLPVRYEVESGRLAGAQVRTDAAAASGGRVVGYIDRRGSQAQIRVFAPAGGEYELRIRHANRSAGEVRHELLVNGKPSMLVVYPGTTPGTWQRVSIGVTLKAGWNTLGFRYRSGITDLDYVDLR